MAQPPARVVRTLEPVGALQLHRLGECVRIHCVQCQRDKTDSLVAIKNRNWAQTVCIACYIALVRPQQRTAKKPAEAKMKPPEAKTKPPEAKKELLEAKKEAAEVQKLRRQLPGLGGLLAFFRAAGCLASKSCAAGACRSTDARPSLLTICHHPRHSSGAELSMSLP